MRPNLVSANCPTGRRDGARARVHAVRRVRALFRARAALRGGAVTLAAALLLAPAPADAQVVPSPYEFIDTTHELGGYLAVISDGRGDIGLGPAGGVASGVRYGVELGGPFAVDVHGFFFPAERDVWDPTPEDEQAQAPILLGSTRGLIAGLEARARFNLTGPRTWRGVAPYLSAGGGVIGDLQARTLLEEDLFGEERFTFGPSFLGVGGVGARWLPTEPVTVRLEALVNFWKLGTPPAFRALDREGFRVPDDQWVGVPTVTLGLSYRF